MNLSPQGLKSIEYQNKGVIIMEILFFAVLSITVVSYIAVLLMVITKNTKFLEKFN